jgi:hypothetical protein
MANFANNDTGRAQAEALVTTRMTAGTWVVGHQHQNFDGNVSVRFQRPMTAALTQGAWVESRDTAAT